MYVSLWLDIVLINVITLAIMILSYAILTAFLLTFAYDCETKYI